MHESGCCEEGDSKRTKAVMRNPKKELSSMTVFKKLNRAIGKQQTEKKERGMCRKNNIFVLMLVGALSLAFNQNLFAQCVVCPAGATDSAVAVGLAAFTINPDGTTGPAIRGAL